ncbi:MAG: DUF3108 domain-containing protein [Candidatus Omnitrophica bacterium]|nr:DUF3108 domain-containing protein [Candidatus Omnitrophota bacterium]
MKINPRVLVLVFSILIFACNARAATSNFTKAGKIPIEPAQKFLRVGEKLTYGVYWMGACVGEGTLHVKEIVKIDGRDASAKTNDFMSAIYKIDDTIHSFIDVKDLCSLRFEKYQREGRYKADEVVVFDQKNHKGYYESLTNKTKKEFTIPDRVQDLTSVFYYFRTLDVKPNTALILDVNADEKNWKATMNVLDTEALEILRQGVHNVFCLVPKVGFKGVISKRGKVWIYVSTDAQRVPVLIKIRIPFGFVVGVLEKTE